MARCSIGRGFKVTEILKLWLNKALEEAAAIFDTNTLMDRKDGKG